MVSNLNEAVPQVSTADQAFEELGGNHIDIGDGHFAFHAPHDSRVGRRESRATRSPASQIIGQLGNSGNTSEAHIHFDVSRGPIPLSSDNAPYEIDRFTLAGSMDDDRDQDADRLAPTS